MDAVENPLSYFRKGAKDMVKEKRLGPSERDKEREKHQIFPEGATLTTQHITRLFQLLPYISVHYPAGLVIPLCPYCSGRPAFDVADAM